MQQHPAQVKLSLKPAPGEIVWYSPDSCRWYLAMVFCVRDGCIELDFPWGARDWAPIDRLCPLNQSSNWPVRTWVGLAEAYFGDEVPSGAWARREVVRFLAIHGITHLDLDEFDHEEVLTAAAGSPENRRAIA
jgi:hypothetical protein